MAEGAACLLFVCQRTGDQRVTRWGLARLVVGGSWLGGPKRFSPEDGAGAALSDAWVGNWTLRASGGALAAAAGSKRRKPSRKARLAFGPTRSPASNQKCLSRRRHASRSFDKQKKRGSPARKAWILTWWCCLVHSLGAVCLFCAAPARFTNASLVVWLLAAWRARQLTAGSRLEAAEALDHRQLHLTCR